MVEYDKFDDASSDVRSIERATSTREMAVACSAWEGDCGSVARAINEIYGGGLVGYFPSGDANIPLHVMVEIDGTLVDGTGRVSLDGIREYFSQKHDGKGSFKEMEKVAGFMVNDSIKNEVKGILKEHK